jgi:uncharacterized coiled-coil DUF342 family protein
MNSREFGKSLENLSADLKREIGDLKVEIRTAKGLKTNLEKLFERGQAVIDKVTDVDTGIDAYHTSAVETKAKIDKANSDAQTILGSIETALESAQSNIEEMETAYEAFTKINDSVNNPETGMEALQESATDIEAEITASKTKADANLALIVTALTKAQTNVEEMETAYEAFTEINDKIIDEDNGLEAILSSSTELKSEIVVLKASADTIYKEIRKFRDDAAGYIKEIGGLKETATAAVIDIEDQHIESLALKEQIEEIFHVGSRGAQANHFVKRRNQLFWISLVWLVLFLGFLVVAGILAINLILPIVDVLKNPNMTVSLEVLIIRVVILSPFIFGAVYSLVQYSSERRLYEKYAFKTITTFSAETSVETLRRVLSKTKSDAKDEKVVDFAINIFNRLYEEPVELKTDKWVFRGGNKLLEVTGELHQSIGNIQKDVDKLVEATADQT